MTGPWSPTRRRRARYFILFLIVGPFLATVTSLFIVPNEPDDLVVKRDIQAEADNIAVTGTLRNFNATAAVVDLRLTFNPSPGLVEDDGTLKQEIDIVIFGDADNSVTAFSKGRTMRPLDVEIPLTGSRVTRYPFDNYNAPRVVIAAGAPSLSDSTVGGSAAVPLTFELKANLADFRSSAAFLSDATKDPGVAISLAFRRNGAVLLWSLILTLLFWAFAAGALMLGWIILAHAQPIPIWSWAFLAGILFALPNLRGGLPGSPPFGSLVDWASFYWSVTITGTVLISILITWFTRQRRSIAGHPVPPSEDA